MGKIKKTKKITEDLLIYLPGLVHLHKNLTIYAPYAQFYCTLSSLKSLCAKFKVMAMLVALCNNDHDYSQSLKTMLKCW